ncbi:hypothetical protein BN7874_001 [Phage NCTB]|nr:hypothetical protein BN7874_001 [Phage NCTB]
MKNTDTAQIVVTGSPDTLSSIRRALEGIAEAGAGGAGVDIIARTGDGDKEVGYFDGDGGAKLSVSEVTKQEIPSESNMKIDLNKGVESQSKKKSARSQMLKMIMPMLSQENGEQLASAIEQKNPGKAKKVMDRITRQLTQKLSNTKK